MNNQMVEDLINSIVAVEGNLLITSNGLADLKLDDADYGKRTKDLDQQAAALQKLIGAYRQLVEDKKPEAKLKWYEKIAWDRIITCAMAIGGSFALNLLLYSWEQNGYYIGKNAAKIQMPRPM